MGSLWVSTRAMARARFHSPWQRLASSSWARVPPLPAATSHTLIGDQLENAKTSGRGVLPRAGLHAYPTELQVVSGAQEVGPRPALGRQLRQDGAWNAGNSRHWAQRLWTRGLLNTSLFRALQNLRAGLLESILPSWAPSDASCSQKNCQAWQGRCSKTGDYYLLSHRQEKGRGVPLCSQPLELCLAHGSGSLLACRKQKRTK